MIAEAWARLSSKATQVVDNHTIRIIRTISATTMTPKLNTRIRRSYDCTHSPAASGIRLVAPAVPLAFTSQRFQFLRIASRNYHSGTQTSITHWGDVLRGINIPRFGVTRRRGLRGQRSTQLSVELGKSRAALGLWCFPRIVSSHSVNRAGVGTGTGVCA